MDDIVDDRVAVDADDVWLGREAARKGGVDASASRIDVRDVHALGEFDRHVAAA